MRILGLILLCLLFTVTSCRKDAIRRDGASSAYFPNTVSDYWEYDVYDSSTVREHHDFPREYTVKVTVAGVKRLVDGKPAKVWQYQYPWGKDTNYVRISGDSIKVFDPAYSGTVEDLAYPRQVFIMPFQLNQRWRGKVIDSSWVISQSTIIMPADTFQGCFDILREQGGPDFYSNDHYWFKPNVGFVKIAYNQTSLGIRLNQLWQLKSYSVR